jgi:hypothetical protein
MNTINTRQTIDLYLDQLPLERLDVIADILAYFVNKENEKATEELLNIPAFVELFEKGKKNAID